MYQYALVGDVGGTNARFALCELANGKISHSKQYAVQDHDSLEAVIRLFLDEYGDLMVKSGCIAIACPVVGDWVEMTNHNWAFSIAEMKQHLDFDCLDVINDFTAVSMAIPMLGEGDVLQMGGDAALPGKPVAVYGAGTGLGVAHLLPVNGQWISLPGEGGHTDFAPNSEEEDAILCILRQDLGHVSAERVLSGPGLVNLYRAIVKIDGRTPDALTPKIIVERALENSSVDCRRVLSLFCVLLGRFGGNLALMLGAFGGVYIAGGIVPRFMDFFQNSGFRVAFEDKGRFKAYLAAIPVFMITHPQPGLLGAGAYLRQVMGYTL
ncbi:glucokinase [Prodigiosinella confusarubida]|uniref:Glucokinase n=1 Tax=Serratia sp. (strain ATCC 39006) TaxID=104623 RepID=A0A2I5T227_SERS3|nr:glucokinase [Serratia sp. ATCC 39006]AUG98636.1 glucokinase [Serratia sp. ATCC 39006]AUH02951.1 glucokinase [Serratia sp. ATCC 39006]